MTLTGKGSLTQRPGLLLLGAIAIEAVLIALHLLALSSGQQSLVRLFHLNLERNLPTWFSSMQLFLVALALFSLPLSRLPATPRWQLLLFAGIFLFLSIDEFVSLHETITRVAKSVAWVPTFNAHGAWILPYCAAAIVLLLLLRKSILWVWRADRHGFLAAASGMALFATGAVGIELVSYYLEPASMLLLISVVLEEWLEMLGSSLILYAVLHLKLTVENSG